MTQGETDPDRAGSEHPAKPNTLIGAKTAIILYGVLVIAAFASLKGKALILAIIIVIGLGAKSYLHYWKEKKGSDHRNLDAGRRH